MGLFKETDHYLSSLAKTQKRIYNDACDEGILVEGFHDELCIRLNEFFKEEFYCGNLKQHRSIERRNNGSLLYSSVSIYLPWEQVSDNLINCTKWTVTYHNDPARRKQFISIFPQSSTATETDIWEKS